MTHAAIVGWGKCLPPSVLTNHDLATFLPTDDEWITTRTGMKERRISHVPGIELAITASRRAIACAGMRGEDIELVIYGSCSNDETVPNSASGVQQRIRATRAAAFDVNTACTSFMYGLSIASSMIKTGVFKNALVIGVELISQYMDWNNRNVAVLFGDGAAAMVLKESEHGTDSSPRSSSAMQTRGTSCGYAAWAPCTPIWACSSDRPAGTSTVRKSFARRCKA